MVISNKPVLPYELSALDFYGPLETTRRGNKYILSIQDMLTKYTNLTPIKYASANEEARALTEKVIYVFGTPATIVTDQCTYFQIKTLVSHANNFRDRLILYNSIPPGMEYLRMYVKNTDGRDEYTAFCHHAYNCTEHESTSYTPHEILFGTKPRTLSSFPR